MSYGINRGEMNKNNEVKEVMLKTLYSTQHETFRMILDKELKHCR